MRAYQLVEILRGVSPEAEILIERKRDNVHTFTSARDGRTIRDGAPPLQQLDSVDKDRSFLRVRQNGQRFRVPAVHLGAGG